MSLYFDDYISIALADDCFKFLDVRYYSVCLYILQLITQLLDKWPYIFGNPVLVTGLIVESYLNCCLSLFAAVMSEYEWSLF